MKHTINHKYKLFFAKIRWFFQTINFAMLHYKAVDNYKFLEKSILNGEYKILALERKVGNEDEIEKLKLQIRVIKDILNYVNRK